MAPRIVTRLAYHAIEMLHENLSEYISLEIFFNKLIEESEMVESDEAFSHE